jgi:hypothetical protein
MTRYLIALAVLSWQFLATASQSGSIRNRSLTKKSNDLSATSASNDALQLQVQEAQADPLQKCYDALAEVVQDRDQLLQEEYLTFLTTISNGDIAYMRFSDLSLLFVSIFLTAACTDGQDCVNEAPALSLKRTGRPRAPTDLEFFCRQILTYTYTEAELSFEYTVRYSVNHAREESIRECLALATENILLDQLAMCAVKEERTRRLVDHTSIRNSDLDATSFIQEFGAQLASIRPVAERILANDNFDPKAGQSSEDSDDGHPDSCPYAIEATITRFTDFRKLLLAATRVVFFVRNAHGQYAYIFTRFRFVSQPASHP